MAGEAPGVADEPDAATGSSPETAGESVSDVISANRAYVKETVAVYAAVGLGLGVTLVLLGAFGSLPISVDAPLGAGEEVTDLAHDGAVDGLSLAQLYLLPLVIVGVATLVAYDADGRFDQPRDGLIAGAAASLVGAVVLTLVAGILFSLQFPETGSGLLSEVPAGSGVSIGLDFGGLFVDGVLYGIGAAATTGAIAYARTAIGEE